MKTADQRGAAAGLRPHSCVDSGLSSAAQRRFWARGSGPTSVVGTLGLVEGSVVLEAPRGAGSGAGQPAWQTMVSKSRGHSASAAGLGRPPGGRHWLPAQADLGPGTAPAHSCHHPVLSRPQAPDEDVTGDRWGGPVHPGCLPAMGSLEARPPRHRRKEARSQLSPAPGASFLCV